VRLAPERAEEARALMLELFPEGFEEIEVGGEIEFAAYTSPGGEERLWLAFGPGAAREVAPDWADAWRRFHRPVRIGPLWIGPPWEAPDDDAVAVVVDPGRAFGTGAHATTRLCLELLLEVEPTSCLDLGCGSGVLAIAAAKLGFAPVAALDSDDAAVEAARLNVAANAVDVHVRRADVLAGVLPPAQVAAANITRADVERIAARLDSHVLIASGYLAAERAALPGWRQADRREAEGWAADLLVRA
jgi:ribosomal protein L11 methyltransferase